MSKREYAFIDSDVGRRALEQRSGADRRAFSWRTVAFGFMRSRRRDVRRCDDVEVMFIDWHHPWLFFLAVGTMLLSCADAFLTLQLLELGMVEANPFMKLLMTQSIGLFAAAKMAITAISILILVYLAKSRFLNRFRTGLLLTLFFTGYACLVCYELVNLFWLL